MANVRQTRQSQCEASGRTAEGVANRRARDRAKAAALRTLAARHRDEFAALVADELNRQELIPLHRGPRAGWEHDPERTDA